MTENIDLFYTISRDNTSFAPFILIIISDVFCSYKKYLNSQFHSEVKHVLK